MKNIFLLLVFIFLPINVFAGQSYDITTGYAYISCSDGSTLPITLPIGAKHEPNNGCVLTEVQDEETLYSMTFIRHPEDIAIDRLIELKKELSMNTEELTSARAEGDTYMVASLMSTRSRIKADISESEALAQELVAKQAEIDLLKSKSVEIDKEIYGR